MESTEVTRVPLDIPAGERHYITYALWSLAKHIKFSQDDFILEAAQRITVAMGSPDMVDEMKAFVEKYSA